MHNGPAVYAAEEQLDAGDPANYSVASPPLQTTIQLLGRLDRQGVSGKTAIVILHHQADMAHTDWLIDLGPGAGHDGGRIVFEGSPAELMAAGPL